MNKLIALILFISFYACESKLKSLEDQDYRTLDSEFLLEMLGLPKKPAPIYLMNISSNTVNKMNVSYMLRYDPNDYQKVNQSDILIGYIAQHKTQTKTIRRMWFDVSINKIQELSSADLRLYRDNSQKLNRYEGLSFNITVYKVYINDSNNETKYIYANSQIVDANYQGWIVINITSCFQWWIDNPTLNDGLNIVTIPIYDNQSVRPKHNPSHRVKPEALGIAGFNGEPDKFAFAVAHYKDLNI